MASDALADIRPALFFTTFLLVSCVLTVVAGCVGSAPSIDRSLLEGTA